MPELRWILLLVGLAVIAGVYWWGHRERARRSRDEPIKARRFEPHLSEGPLPRRRLEPQLPEEVPPDGEAAERRAVAAGEDQLISAALVESGGDEATAAAAGRQNKIIALRVAPAHGGRLGAREVVDALVAAHLEHGKYQIFHYGTSSGRGRPIFSVASMVEPGSFDLDRLDGVTLPGVTVFMVLPGPVSGVDAFDRMLETARGLAVRLECVVQDEVGSSLTPQRIAYIRDEIIEFQVHRGKVTGGAGLRRR